MFYFLPEPLFWFLFKEDLIFCLISNALQEFFQKQWSSSFLLYWPLICFSLELSDLIFGGQGLWKFNNSLTSNAEYTEKIKSSHPEVLLRKGVLKICSKFTKEHPCQSAIAIKQHLFLRTLLSGCFWKMKNQDKIIAKQFRWVL